MLIFESTFIKIREELSLFLSLVKLIIPSFYSRENIGGSSALRALKVLVNKGDIKHLPVLI